MKLSEIKIGSCYRIDKKFSDIQSVSEGVKDGSILEFLENGNKDKRPFCCIDIDQDGIVWLAPMSTNVEKYKKIARRKIEQYGNNNSVVFTKWNNRDNAILLQNLIPILPKYIEDNYLLNVTLNYGINYKTMEVVKKKLKFLRSKYDRGIKVIFPDIDKLREYMLANDFRLFGELDAASRREVISRYYFTDILKANENWSNEAEIVAYEKEICNISERLFKRKDIEFNPHTFERIQQLTYQFGNTPFHTFKGKKRFYIPCSSAHEALIIAKTLEYNKINYRGVINEDNTGQIQILDDDKKRLRNALRAPSDVSKALGNISYLSSRKGDCVAFSGVFECAVSLRFANAIAKNKKRFRLEFDKAGKGKLMCYEKDVDDIRSILSKELDLMRAEQQKRNLVSENLKLYI